LLLFWHKYGEEERDYYKEMMDQVRRGYKEGERIEVEIDF
jgi:hypothetical protein